VSVTSHAFEVVLSILDRRRRDAPAAQGSRCRDRTAAVPGCTACRRCRDASAVHGRIC
jgi:hypothetical protein